MPGKGGGGGGGGPKQDGPLNLNGNKNDNILTGGAFADIIWGRDGNDTLIGQGDDDFIHGGNHDDIVIGDFGSVASDGTVTINETAEDGDDRLFGGNGDDQLYGGGGDDELQGGAGWDILDGGSGYDLALYSADDEAIVVNPDGSGGFVVDFVGVLPTEFALNIEGIVGTYYDDQLNGADGAVNTFNGYYGDDVINGGDQGDWLDGHGDNDTIDGKAGADMIAGGSGTDTLTGGADADTFIFYTAYDGADTITDFSGFGGDGDKIDLTALDLTTAAGVGDPITDGFVFVVGGTELYVDLDGGGTADGTGDDILLATSGAGVIDVNTDVLI